MEYILEQVADRSPTSCSEVAERSPISRRPIADQSPTSFSDSHAPILTKLVGDRSATSRRLIGDWSATLPGLRCDQISRLCKHKNLAATDLVATRSPISRRLLCNLAGTDRGPCCDLCDWCKLSVAERSQSGCNVCLTGAYNNFYNGIIFPSLNHLKFFHSILDEQLSTSSSTVRQITCAVINTLNEIKCPLLPEFLIYNFSLRILESVSIGNIVNIRNECLLFCVHGE